MDLECMSDSSCEYEDLDSSDSVTAGDTSSVLNNFENRFSEFCQDVTFGVPITNQITYPSIPTLIKVPSGNGYKYLLLQPAPVQAANSENNKPNVAVVVDVTEKVVEVPAGNPPIPATNKVPAPPVQKNAQLVHKKATTQIPALPVQQNAQLVHKKATTQILAPPVQQNAQLVHKKSTTQILAPPVQQNAQLVHKKATTQIPALPVQQNTQLVNRKATKKSTQAAKSRNQPSIPKKVETPALLSENRNPSTGVITGFLPKRKQVAQELLVKPLREQSSNHIAFNQEVRTSQASSAQDLNFLLPVQENIEIASTQQPAKSVDYSPPIHDIMGFDYDMLFQAWDDNSQQPGINSTVVHENVEAVYDETFDDFKVSTPSAVNQKSTATSRKKKPGFKKEPKDIATLVFFDLETTGLPHTVGTSNVQVTEVSMIAVDRREFCKSQSPELKDWRLIHKLTMVVKPRSYISSVAADITGLDDIMLKDQAIFDENTAKAVVSFLSHLTKPACLLAHNGKRFDFPLLKAELKRHDMDFPDEIYMADTLLGLRAVDVGKLPSTPKTPKSVKRNKDGKLSMTLENLHTFFFNRKHQGGHSSEGDCVALAKVCHKTKDTILPWIDENCVSGDTVIPMW